MQIQYIRDPKIDRNLEDKSFIDITDTYIYLEGSNLKSKLISSDSTSIKNKIFPRPQAIVISDTFNNPLFPINAPELDTSKFDLRTVKRIFKSKYSGISLSFLPWHYVIEFVQDQYFVFNTRPIDMKFPVDMNTFITLIKNYEGSGDIAKYLELYSKYKPFLIEDSIHICIIGNTNKDIYLKDIYEVIANNCIVPILAYFKIPKDLWMKIWSFTGKRFDLSLLEKYIHIK